MPVLLAGILNSFWIRKAIECYVSSLVSYIYSNSVLLTALHIAMQSKSIALAVFIFYYFKGLMEWEYMKLGR